MKIKPVAKSELEEVRRLLIENDLPVEDIEDEIVQIFVTKIKNKIVGMIGLEIHNSTGLLRSLAVKKECRNLNIGKYLVEYLEDICRKKGIIETYLLTTTAEKYFEKLNFKTINRKNVPELIQKTKQFADICPVSAVVMKKV